MTIVRKQEHLREGRGERPRYDRLGRGAAWQAAEKEVAR